MFKIMINKFYNLTCGMGAIAPPPHLCFQIKNDRCFFTPPYLNFGPSFATATTLLVLLQVGVDSVAKAALAGPGLASMFSRVVLLDP